MFKFILLVFALAGHGLYSIFSGVTTTFGPSKEALTTRNTSALVAEQSIDAARPDATASLSEATLDLAKKFDISIEPLPEKGCTPSMLSGEKVRTLLGTAPEPLKSNLYQVLDLSEPVWSAQFYFGAQGTGLCLPRKNRLVVLPVQLGSIFEVFYHENLSTDAAKGWRDSAQKVGKSWIEKISIRP